MHIKNFGWLSSLHMVMEFNISITCNSTFLARSCQQNVIIWTSVSPPTPVPPVTVFISASATRFLLSNHPHARLLLSPDDHDNLSCFLYIFKFTWTSARWICRFSLSTVITSCQYSFPYLLHWTWIIWINALEFLVDLHLCLSFQRAWHYYGV